MSPPVVRVRGWNVNGNGLDFIHSVRTFTGVDLRTAKTLLDRLRAGEEVELQPLDMKSPVALGEDLLKAGVVLEAELVVGNQPAQSIAPPPPPPPAPVFICPVCRRTLKQRTECHECGWLCYPSERARWGQAGPCPRCGFSYQYDGSSCSHCGRGSTEQPPLVGRTAKPGGTS